MAGTRPASRGKLHGLTWAPQKQFAVRVRYRGEGAESPRVESFPVVAFDRDGDPIMMDRDGLLTVRELCDSFAQDAEVSWALEAA